MNLRENLVIKKGNEFLLLNLYDMSRSFVPYDKFVELKQYIHSSDMTECDYNRLLNKKQFLTDKEKNAIDMVAKLKYNQIHSGNITHVQICLSYECNFSCSYCYQRNRKSVDKITVNDIDCLHDVLMH